MVAQATMAKSIEQFLEPGEELRSVLSLRAQASNPMGGPLFWNWLDITPDGVELSKHMAVAVTSSRVLILRAGGRMVVEAKEIATEMPLSEVGQVEARKSLTATRLSWSARGYQYTVKADTPKATALMRALAGTDPEP
jgi:hypothetical protein